MSHMDTTEFTAALIDEYERAIVVARRRVDELEIELRSLRDPCVPEGWEADPERTAIRQIGGECTKVCLDHAGDVITEQGATLDDYRATFVPITVLRALLIRAANR